ncbi:heterokaryon incompatibility protein-domain-containing protein [Nemania sp. FL0916]|nr:heterokaryon incompatibility protein-domain-containing protein [Nemania sp. FL0916]
MSSFVYKPLELGSSTFRIVRLLGGTADEIECELIHTKLGENAISYEAVSYTWGSSQKPHSINIQGEKLNVTSNLWSLLHDLRLPATNRYLWIDAIAINQDDIAERGHQVQRITDIYSSADRVLFCIGRGSNNFTDNFMAALLELEKVVRGCWDLTQQQWWTAWLNVQNRLQLRYGSQCGQYQREGLEQILSQKWFRRAWIVQEVASARSALVYYGADFVLSPIFVKAVELIVVSPDEHTQAIINSMPGPTVSTRVTHHRELYSLLIQFCNSEASDPRDRIFALLGLCAETWPFEETYSLTEEELIDKLNKHLFQSEDDLSICHERQSAVAFHGSPFNWMAAKRDTSTAFHEEKPFSPPELTYYEALMQDVSERTPRGNGIDQYLFNLRQIYGQARYWDIEPAFHLLFQRRYQRVMIYILENRKSPFEVTPAMFWIAAGLEPSGKMMELLIQYGSKITIDAKDLVPTHLKRHDLTMRIIEALLRPGKQSVKINTDVFHLRQLLLFTPRKYIKRAAEMSRAKDREAANIIYDLRNQPSFPPSQEQLAREIIIDIFHQRARNKESEQIYLFLTAVKIGKIEIGELLMRKRASLKSPFGSRLTPSMEEAEGLGWEFITRLLATENMIKPGFEFFDGSFITEIPFANRAVAAVLLERDSRDEAMNRWFPIIPKPVADILRDNQMIGFFLGEQDDPNPKSKPPDVLSPLHHAAQRGYLTIVELLLEAGADVNSRDYQGKTPIALARKNGHVDVVRFLISAGADEPVNAD